ncbi:MAG: penicillin-binding transpeptidase domain-containing protein [Patescibacteria group bacterium]|nr:penicillin-binding transpeptidase domain-containing protein [Patescibacteria group bacterium]
MAVEISSTYIQQDVKWSRVRTLRGHYLDRSESSESPESEGKNGWRIVYLYVTTALGFGVLFMAVVNLQLVHGRDYAELSKQNRLDEHVVQPDRGIIYDRFGEKIAINVPCFNIMFNPREVEDDEISEVFNLLGGIIEKAPEEFDAKLLEAIDIDPQAQKVLMAHDVSRDFVLSVLSHTDELIGIWIDYSSKRNYIGGEAFSHIIGYTGEADLEFVEANIDVDTGDVVGREGIEYFYDERFRGERGSRIVETDVAQNVVAEYVNEGSAPVTGDSLYMSIDAESQRKWYEILNAGMEKYGATGAAAVLENVNTGEVWSAVSLPSYNNNVFVGGVSEEDYGVLMANDGLPLFNRVISAQEPPGSMFKTIVASAALQEGAITRDTVFVSTGVMYLGVGYPFQEYHQHAYGALDLIGGIAKSSNIYFCKTMLQLGIDKFVPYAEFFGIGTPTGIDLEGEACGRVPSPENKIALAETSPWLDPIWYPAGDSCNSAIGQGIVSVTPIQVANWAATIANGGNVMKPRLAHKWDNETGDADEESVEPEIVRSGVVSDENLAYVREGMRNSASGPLSVIVPLRNTKVPVAGKTGTAEFGVKDEKGYYTRTHAWVKGFFPYDDPEFSFVVFLEGGGESNNAAQLASEFINWFAEARVDHL